MLQVVGRRVDISIQEEWGQRAPRTQIIATGAGRQHRRESAGKDIGLLHFGRSRGQVISIKNDWKQILFIRCFRHKRGKFLEARIISERIESLAYVERRRGQCRVDQSQILKN